MPENPRIPDELTDASRGDRIQKVMARAGVASRRECEALVTEGRVSVNGQPVTDLPAWVDPARDRIEVDGEPVVSPRGQKRREQKGRTYLMLHKPRRVISTTDDEQGRRDVLDLIDEHLDARVFPVGRLDAESTGLILLTDDGELANRLTHPRHGVPKEYLVTLRGRLTEDQRQKLQRGLYLAPAPGSSGRSDGKPAGKPPRKPTLSDRGRPPARRAAMDQVRILRHERDRTRGDRTVISVTLREGQNREIRRLLARLGHKVRHLKRTAIGPLRLADLPVGGWRRLTGDEIRRLRHAAGLK